VLLLAGGCGGAAETGFDPNQPAVGPLTALGDCGPLPEPAADVAVPAGAVLPDGAVVTSATPQDPLVTLTAEVHATPVEIRVAFEARDDVELIVVEDEVWESEILLSDGTHRTYLRSSAICATGSTDGTTSG
jgi:hypothetical protein